LSNKSKTYAVGQGLRLPLSAQGNKDEQLIFHPPNMEYVRAPQPGQYLKFEELRYEDLDI
jgi:hypothetical protein